jgi:hypothetical protein
MPPRATVLILFFEVNVEVNTSVGLLMRSQAFWLCYVFYVHSSVNIIYIYIYKYPTRCTIYFLFHCKFTLNVSGDIYTHHQVYRKLFGGNGSIAWTSAVSYVGRTSNAFKVTMKLQTFLFQMVVTSCISVQYLWIYGFATVHSGSNPE